MRVLSSRLYFSELLTEANFALRFVPRPLTTATIAIEIPAAIRPYSMAVAPDSSFRKRKKAWSLLTPVERRLEPSSQELRPGYINCSKATDASASSQVALQRCSLRFAGNHLVKQTSTPGFR